jgi:APA family basic amino acid/polyamine antiporter
MKHLFRKKNIEDSALGQDDGSRGLKRHLKSHHLVAIGIGAIIGAGIFVVTGQAAALYAGPAIVFSFAFAAVVCIFTALCYAELSSIIPSSGGSYSYSYVAFGEFPAWMVAWALFAQFLSSIAAVSVGWGGYFMGFLSDFGIKFSSAWTQSPLAYLPNSGWTFTGAIINLPAVLLILFLGVLVSIGIRAVTHFNNAMVFIKLGTVILFILIGIPYINAENWVPFVPANTGSFGEFGWSGVFRAAGLVFFAYMGFDTVATLSREAINPQKDIPKGILGSLLVSTGAYILVSLVLVGIVKYTSLNVPDPMGIALSSMGAKFMWFTSLIKIAIIAALATVALIQMVGLTRICLEIGKDGLLPEKFSSIHPKFRTPVFASIVTTVITVTLAALFPIDVLFPIATLPALFIFALVCLSVIALRKSHPHLPRAFKVPFVPYVPVLGALVCIGQMCMLPMASWIQLLVWFAIGTAVYFAYGKKHSAL